MMAKVLTLLRRDAACEDAAFTGHWREYLATLWSGPRKLSGLIRVVHNEAVATEVRAMPGNEWAGWTAVSETWFETAAGAGAAIVRMRADHAAGQHAGRLSAITHLPVEEILLHDSGIRPLAVKIMVFFKRRADLSRQAAQAHWQGPHARLGMETYNATDFMKRYLQNHVTLDFVNPDAAHDYDGGPEFWMENIDATVNVSADSEVMKAIAADEKNFADVKSIESLNVREYELFARDREATGWVAA